MLQLYSYAWTFLTHVSLVFDLTSWNIIISLRNNHPSFGTSVLVFFKLFCTTAPKSWVSPVHCQIKTAHQIAVPSTLVLIWVLDTKDTLLICACERQRSLCNSPKRNYTAASVGKNCSHFKEQLFCPIRCFVCRTYQIKWTLKAF